MALASLGLGILAGAVSLHGEVWISNDLAKQKWEQVKQLALGTQTNLKDISSHLPRRYKIASLIFYASLVVSVVSLVLYEIIAD